MATHDPTTDVCVCGHLIASDAGRADHQRVCAKHAAYQAAAAAGWTTDMLTTVLEFHDPTVDQRDLVLQAVATADDLVVVAQQFDPLDVPMYRVLRLPPPDQTPPSREVHIRQRQPRVWGNGFYKPPPVLPRTLCGAEPTTRDMGYGETRYPSQRQRVTCAACVARRQRQEA